MFHRKLFAVRDDEILMETPSCTISKCISSPALVIMVIRNAPEREGVVLVIRTWWNWNAFKIGLYAD